MLNNITLGTYYPGKSVLHRLQARTKLVAILIIIITLLIADQREWHFAPFIALIVLLASAIAISNIAFHEIWRRTWLLLLLTVIGALTVLFSLSDKTDKVLYAIGPVSVPYGIANEISLGLGLVLLGFLLLTRFKSLRSVWNFRFGRTVRMLLILLTIVILGFWWVIRIYPPTQNMLIGPVPITYSGVWSFVSFTMVLLSLYVFSLLLTMTTSPVALIEGMTMLMAPLQRLKLPVNDFALMMLLALRFIPTLFEEVEQLTKAQAARGSDLMHGTIAERVGSLMMLFVPLMQAVFRRAAELATALEARGYENEGNQTRLYEKKLQVADYTVLGIVLVSMIGTFFIF